MQNAGRYVSIFLICTILASCQSHPRRPDAAICTAIIGEMDYFECTNSRGIFRVNAIDVLATDQDGYEQLQRYIEEIEAQNKRLRRRCQIE